MSTMRSLRAVLAALALGVGLQAHAQDPRPPIRLLVGFAPGGATDSVARAVADRLRPVLDRQVIVDNRPGAGGRLAAELLKNAPADGSTYMLAPNASGMFVALTTPASQQKYDFLKDQVPVATVVSYPLALAVSASLGIHDAKAYAAWLKAHPDKAVFGTAGLGGETHFNGLQFAKAAGVTLVNAPYRGNGPLVTDLTSGQIPAGVLVIGDAMAQVRSGKVRLVGVFSRQRSPLAPEVPTMAEQGFDVGGGDGWIGMWASSRTPRAEIERMEAALKQVMALPEMREAMVARAMSPDFRGAQQTAQQVRREFDYWGPVIKASGFNPDQ